MKFADLKADSIIIEWIDTISPKKTTEASYIRAMDSYTEYLNKSPRELITNAEREIKDGLLPRERTVKHDLIGYRRFLQDKKLSPLSVKSYMTRVTSFYKTFDIEIPKIPRSERRAQTLEENNKIPTKEDIQEVLKVCDLMETAIVLVGVSSGLSAQEIVNLKIKDFTSGYDPETEITTLKLRRQKVGFDFITFLSPECSRAINEYLAYRNREIKSTDRHRINQVKKQNVTTENGYLFISRLISPEFLKTKNEELRKIEPRSLVNIYRTISEKARKNTPFGNWNLIRSHNLRKYFNSIMLNNGADSFFVEYCMGHTLDETKAAYFRACPEKLREIYIKFMPYLIIQKDADISESPEYLRIRQENQVLQSETARHIVERSEIQDLRAEIEKLKQAAAEKESNESTFSDIIAGQVSALNQDADYSIKYKQHINKMKTDSEYRKRFNEYQAPFMFDVFSMTEHEAEAAEYRKKEIEDKQRFNKKLSTLMDKL